MIERVQGDEPTKYINSKTSRETSTQERFYIQGLHKKQGKFSHAVDHLVSSQVKCDDDDHTIVTEPTNIKMDMSHIDFGNKRVKKKDDSADSQEDQSSKIQDNNEKVLPSLSITSELDS